VPFVLIAFGLILSVAGARGTQSNLFTLLKGDFTGNQSFIWWFLSILGIGALGYIKDLRAFSNAFLALVLVVLILAQNKNGNNLFSNFINAIKSGTGGAATPATVTANDNAATAPSVTGLNINLLNTPINLGAALGGGH
jgi:hypothetical protein